MRRVLAWIAAVVALGTTVAWLGLGANRGFTKTSLPVPKTDEITGIAYTEYEKRFQPGIELAGLGWLLAAGCFVASRFCHR